MSWHDTNPTHKHKLPPLLESNVICIFKSNCNFYNNIYTREQAPKLMLREANYWNASMEELPIPKLIQEFQKICKIQNLATPNIYWIQPLQERETFSTCFLMEQKSNTIIVIDKSLCFSPHFSSTTLNFPQAREDDFMKIS